MLVIKELDDKKSDDKKPDDTKLDDTNNSTINNFDEEKAEQLDKEMHEAEELFYEESRTRGKLARSVHSRATHFESNNYTVRQLNKLHGKVIEYNMFDDLGNLIPYADFMKLKKEDRKSILSKFCEKHSNIDIAKHWGTTSNYVFVIKKRAGIKLNKTKLKEMDILVDYRTEIVNYEQYKALDYKGRVIAMQNLIDKFKRDDGSPDVIKMAGFWGVKKQQIYDNMRNVGLSKPRKVIGASANTDSGKLVERKGKVKGVGEMNKSEMAKSENPNTETQTSEASAPEVKIVEKIVERFVEKVVMASDNQEVHTFARQGIKGKALSAKFMALAKLVEDGQDYDVTIRYVEHYKEDKEDTESKENKEYKESKESKENIEIKEAEIKENAI